MVFMKECLKKLILKKSAESKKPAFNYVCSVILNLPVLGLFLSSADFFNKIIFLKKIIRNTITVSNNLDPYLGQNYLQWI